MFTINALNLSLVKSTTSKDLSFHMIVELLYNFYRSQATFVLSDFCGGYLFLHNRNIFFKELVKEQLGIEDLVFACLAVIVFYLKGCSWILTILIIKLNRLIIWNVPREFRHNFLLVLFGDFFAETILLLSVHVIFQKLAESGFVIQYELFLELLKLCLEITHFQIKRLRVILNRI